MKEKPVKGQKLYSLNVGNSARHSKKELTEVEVIKVGRKYFTCCPKNGSRWQEVQYHIDGWFEKTDYSATSVLYKSHEELENKKEELEICRMIEKSFQFGQNHEKVPLPMLRAFRKIIEG